MRTLYLRNVPDEVYDRLARLAAIDHTSVGAFAVRELAEVSRRADNPSLLARLPDLVIDGGSIAVELDVARDER